MDKRELSRLLRRSNVGDLIDDGVENGSDLKSSARIEEPKPKAPEVPARDLKSSPRIEEPEPRAPEVPAIDLPTQPKHRKVVLGRQPKPAAPEREPASRTGVFLGACFLLPGIVLFLFPKEILVYHARLNRGPSPVEHVTTQGAQVYAVIAILVGIAVCALSLYRPKR